MSTPVPDAGTADRPIEPSRRATLKVGAAMAQGLWAPSTGGLLAAAGVAVASEPRSPATQPFLEALPIPPILPARSLADPAFAQPPTTAPNRRINPATRLPYEGRGDAHQHRELNPPRFLYAQRFGAVPPTSIHPSLPKQVNLWGANLGGSDLRTDPPRTPMPTIVSRYQAGANTAILVRRFNDLPRGTPSGGFGFNQISTHLHNFHSAPDSDGGPCDPRLGAWSEDPIKQGRFFFPGQYYDYYYNMKRAGFSNPATPDGDVRETLGTLWYHDHREAHTAENVVKGLAGFHLIFNEYDTGDERTGFRLPSFPQFDLPLMIASVGVDPATLQLSYDPLDTEGRLGDKYLANGKIQPYCQVSRRRYRLRLLNAGPTRFLRLFLTNPDNPSQSIPYWRISNDGNLMPAPLQVRSVTLSVGERADLIVDFAKLTAPGGPAAGATRLWLENRLVQDDPRGPRDELAPAGRSANTVVEFRLGAVVADGSRDPATISNFAPITLPPLATPTITRTFKFGRNNGQWSVNGRLINCDEVRFAAKLGTTERWIFQTGGGWSHPIHNHFVAGRIVKRNGVAIGPGDQEYSRKDVVNLGPGDEVEYIVKMADYRGVYPIHCHNVAHEDHAMMLLFEVNDIGDRKSEP